MTRKEIERIADLVAERLREKEDQRHKDRLVDVREAMEITGLAAQTLYNRKMEIGYVKRGRGLYFQASNLEAYNRSRER